jgi:hypothetical protein
VISGTKKIIFFSYFMYHLIWRILRCVPFCKFGLFNEEEENKTSVRASSTIVLINLSLQTSLYIYSLYLITRIYS